MEILIDNLGYKLEVALWRLNRYVLMLAGIKNDAWLPLKIPFPTAQWTENAGYPEIF